MGFLDKAKKLAEQATEAMSEVGSKVQQAANSATSSTSTAGAPSAPPPGGGAWAPPPSPAANGPASTVFGTAYVPGMLGRPAWREKGLTDPAALLPVRARDRVGLPHSTKSVILEEPYGMGRRWTAGDRSAGLFYQLYPEHQSWQPPGGAAPSSDVAGATTATSPEGRSLVFLGAGEHRVVLELAGFGDDTREELANLVAARL